MTNAKRFPQITITGDLGSGKSVVSRLLQKKTGFPIYSTGKIQREIARKHHMTTLELNHYAETHPQIDTEIDNYSRDLGERQVSLIVDSRLAWHFIPRSFKVYLAVDANVAAQRIFDDKERKSETYQDIKTASQQIRARKASENKRFLERYGADCADMKNFDLVVDTSHLTPHEVMAQVLESFESWCNQ